MVASWVGFANEPAAPPGTLKPTTEWPIQKYLWSDFMVGPGDQVAYQVVPVVGQASALRRHTGLATAWTAPITIGAETAHRASCYFNRGIVASQWLSRLLPQDHPATKASGVNDENHLLIQGNAALASQYAGNTMQIYSQYRWRKSVQEQDGQPKWRGLADWCSIEPAVGTFSKVKQHLLPGDA